MSRIGDIGYGLNIYVYDETLTPHHSPHFQVRLNNRAVLVIDIRTLEKLHGNWNALDGKQQKVLQRWMRLYQQDILEAWNTIQQGGAVGLIPPKPSA